MTHALAKIEPKFYLSKAQLKHTRMQTYHGNEPIKRDADFGSTLDQYLQVGTSRLWVRFSDGWHGPVSTLSDEKTAALWEAAWADWLEQGED